MSEKSRDESSMLPTTSVDLTFPSVSAKVTVEEITGDQALVDIHHVRFFHIRFPENQALHMPLARAVAKAPEFFYQQLVVQIDGENHDPGAPPVRPLPTPGTESPHLWERLEANLRLDVETAAEIRAAQLPPPRPDADGTQSLTAVILTPICSQAMCSWIPDTTDQLNLLDLRISISTHT